ncbi:hypothetical protein [Endozoicomonas sp. NE40]|uniref:LamG-like jellyroll fold domain-containing protein n=1 Tax=Endozoicomonas lisbonensis TaxID=3120522 RepID=A0ABV2SN14_9GAMM
MIIQNRPDDSSTNANPEWTGTFPHEGKLEISFAGKTDTITVQDDDTWSYQFSEVFDFGRHTVTFTGTQTGLPGTAIEQDSFTVAMPDMQLTIDEAPGERTNLILTEWKGSGAAPNAKVTLTLATTKGDLVEQTVDADDQGFFTIALKLIEGSYSTTLTATASGYQDASLAGSNVTVDRTGPVLQVDPGFKPTAGTCTMTGTATDHLGKPEPVGSVVVKLDSGQSYPGSIKGGHFSVELINLAPNHTYNAEITGSDDLSNAGTTQLEVLSIPPLPVTALQFSKEPDSLTNNDTLEWEGKTTPGATIDLIIKTPSGNYVSKDVTADTSGFFALSEKVTEGSHTVRFMASAPGHKANILPDKDITVDHTGPELTIDPGFQLTAGTCTLTGKALDQDGHPEPKGSVTVQVPAIQQSFTGTISNGIFNVQIDGLKHAQTYKLSLSATDELKNTGQPLDTSYTTPSQPVTNLQFSEEPDSLTSKDTLQWKGSATADATVTLTLTPATGQPVTNQVKADSKGLFTISEPVNEGQYTASFTASAPGYQDKQLPDTAITVDHTGPELTIDPGFQLTAGTCTLTGKALDQDGHPEPKGSVNVQVPAIQQSFTGTISNGIFNVQIDGLKHAQTYKLSLSATDELKNTGQPLDTSYTTPSQPVTNLQFSEEPDSLTSKDTLQWKGSATADATVTLTLTPATGQPVTNQVKADSKGLFTISEPVNEGQYTASFTASAPGYQDKQLPDTAITVDQTGPELTIDPGFQLTAGTCTLTGKALDQDGHPEPKGSVTVQVPAIQQSFTGTISNGIFNVQIDGLKHAQTYKLSLSATDELKNTGQPLDTSYTTPSQPVTNLQFSEEPDSLTSKDTLQWKGSATADATVTLTLTPATGQPVTNQVKADSKGLFTISEPVNEGQYTASFTASAPGYQDKQLPDTAITVDHTGPELTIDPGFQLTAGTCTLTGKALDQDGHPEPKGSVTVQVPGIQKPFTGIISNGIFSVQIDSLKPGQTYQLHLSATDVLKNTSFLDESYTTPDTYDFAVTSALNTDTKSIVLKGTHPLPRGRVQLKLTGDHVNTIDKNNGIITGRAKNHEWSLEINNLLLKQEVKVNLYAMDDAAKALDAKLLSNVPELQENLIVDGDRDSNIGNLKALSGAGVYGHHIVMYAAKCSGKCNDKDGLTPWKVELTSPVQPNAKVHVTLDSDIVTIKGKTRKVQDRPYIKTIKLDASGKAILEQPLDYTKKGNLKIDLSSEHMKLATIRFKAEGLEHNEEVFIGVETPSLHYTFDNIRPGQDTLVSQTYPAQAKISGSINQVQGSLGSGLQLGKGALQIQDFKDLFNDSYTICFDIKTSAKASTGNQLFPSLAGYYDETSNTGAKTHLFGAFNEKGQIGIADHNSGLFAEPVVADGQWHSVCISRTLVDQSTSTYRMLIDGKQSDISKDGSSVTGKEAQSIHGMILGSPVSEYPVELLGGVTKSNSPDQVEYLDAVLDNFTAYPIKMETPYESLAYAHVHWGCPNPGPCYYKDEFPAGLMINNIMETRLTPHCSLYLQLKPDASKNSLGTSFTVRYKGTDLDPLDKSVAGDVNVYKLDHVSAENLATLTVKPADPEATHKFELHFDRTVSDLVRVTGKDVSMPDGIIKFDSSASPLGSGISFGVGKEQSYSPSEGDPNCILEDRHLVTEPGTVINGYDIKYYSIIDLNGLREELKTLTQESDMSGKLLKLMSEGSAQQGTENQVQLQDPCKIKDPDCTNDPLVTINTVDNNPAIALSLDGQITYYQHT